MLVPEVATKSSSPPLWPYSLILASKNRSWKFYFIFHHIVLSVSCSNGYKLYIWSPIFLSEIILYVLKFSQLSKETTIRTVSKGG